MNKIRKEIYLYYLNNFDKIKNIIIDENDRIPSIVHPIKLLIFHSEHVALIKRCIELNLLKDDFSFDTIFKAHLKNPELDLFKDYNMLNFYPYHSRKDHNIDFIPFNDDDCDHSYLLQKDFDLFRFRFFYHFSDNITIKNESLNLEKYNMKKNILNLFNSNKYDLILYNNGVVTPSYFFFFDRGNIIYNNDVTSNAISVKMPNVSFKLKDIKYYLKIINFYSNDFLNTSKKFIFLKNHGVFSVKGTSRFLVDDIIFKSELPLSTFKNFKTYFSINSKFYTNAFFDRESMSLFFKHKDVMLFKKLIEPNNSTRIKYINDDNIFLDITDKYLTESSLPIINLYFSFFENKALLFNKKTNHIVKNLKNHIKQNEDLNKIEKQLFLLYSQ